MKRSRVRWSWAFGFVASVACITACGGDDEGSGDNGGDGNTSGTSGTAGSGGTLGAAGSGGTSGTAGAGATAGVSGAAGGGGTAGTAGMSGAAGMSGGMAGGGGTAGMSGAAGMSGGMAGMSGMPGMSGAAGMSGGMAGMSGMSGMSGAAGMAGMGGMSGMSGAGGTAGTSGMSGAAGMSGMSGMAGMSGMSGMGGAAGMSGMAGASGAGMGGAAGLGGMGGAGMGGGGGTTGPNLFFSEYVESSPSQPDVLEILNAGTSAVDLSACRVLLYQNGSTTANPATVLMGTLAVNDVYVVCSTAIGTTCDVVNGGLSSMDGNDALSLVCTVGGTDTVMDVIGQIGNNPAGGEWGNATVGTGDQTLRRMCSVTTGDRNGADAFDPATQWQAFPVDTANGVGSRTCPCPGGNTTCP
jgi:hypothetical protein